MFEVLGVFPAGIILGLFYFGGLLWTVNRGLVSKYPWLWFFSSWLIRLGVLTVSLVFILDGQWERLLVCVAGFMLARVAVIRYSRSMGARPSFPKEVHDASKSR